MGAEKPAGTKGAMLRLAALRPRPDFAVVGGPLAPGDHVPVAADHLAYVYADGSELGDDGPSRRAESAGFSAVVWTRPLVTVAADAIRRTLVALNDGQVTEGVFRGATADAEQRPGNEVVTDP
jgi:hypothetical protein